MPELATQSHTTSLGDVTVELRWAEVTDRGRRRDNNQDAVLAQYPLYVVADGMGGHVGGEIASTRTIERLREIVSVGDVTPESIENALERAVADITEHPESTDEGTGTTLTGVYLDVEAEQPTWVTVNIGDSRVYIYRDESLAQVTTDHSVVQELISSGRLSVEEAENHPYGNVITRAVGPSEGVVPDYVRLEVVDGDRFVVCSDGLTKELTDYGILHYLMQHDDPAEAVSAMLSAALENGGRDNISIIVMNASVTGDLGDDDSSSPATSEGPVLPN